MEDSRLSRSGTESSVSTPSRARNKIKPFIWVAASFSVVVNILMLVTPLYMLQVYDRVLTSGSVETLVLISALALGLMITFVFADSARRHALALAANYMQENFGEKVFNQSLATSGGDRTIQKDLSDLSVIQSFYSNGLILPLFDLPFTPIFILIMFLVHPIIGFLGIAGAVVLLLITVFAEITSRNDVKKAQSVEVQANQYAGDVTRQQSAILTMGMEGAAYSAWASRKGLAGDLSLDNAKSSSMFGATTKAIRQSLQIAALGIGGWLVLQHQATPGVIIAASILVGRAMAPIDHCVGMWRQIIRARQSWSNLSHIISGIEEAPDVVTPLPRPSAHLAMTNLQVGFPGAEAPILPKFNLTIDKPSIIAVVGPSGAGKTTMLQTLAGAWPPMEGKVSLGGRDLHQWDRKDRGKYVGYLPQDSELLPGTIVQNIGRFTGAESEDVIEVTKECGFHEMMLALTDGYDAEIGHGKTKLSGGEKQAVGISRAFFGDPVLVVLDEPSANLDRFGSARLKSLFQRKKKNGSIVIFSTHDVNLIRGADQLLLVLGKEIKLITPDAYLNAINIVSKPKDTAREQA